MKQTHVEAEVGGDPAWLFLFPETCRCDVNDLHLKLHSTWLQCFPTHYGKAEHNCKSNWLYILFRMVLFKFRLKGS